MSLAKKTAFTFANKLFVSAIAFINSALLARYLGKVDRGLFQAAGTWSTTGTTFVGGYTGYYSWALSKRPDDAARIVQMGNMVVGMASVIVLALVIGLRPEVVHTLGTPAWWAIFCMPLAFSYNYATKLLQGINEIPWLNRTNTLQSILFFAATLCIFLERHHLPEHVKIHLTYIVWVSSFLLSSLLSIAIAYRLIHKHGLLKWRFHGDEWRGTMRYGGWLSVSYVANYANYRMDFWWVMAMVSGKDLSEYGVAVVASEVLVQIATSIQSVLFTRMTGGERGEAITLTEAATRQTLITAGIAAIGMYLIFPWLITLVYGHRYAGSVAPFLVLLPGLIFRAGGNLIIQYFTNQLGDPKVSIWMNGVAALINAICCLLLVPHLGTVGGGLASTISYVLAYYIYALWFARVNHVSPMGLIKLRKADFAPYFAAVRSVARRVGRR